MQSECSECGTMNPADSTFCGNCGAVLAPVGVEQGPPLAAEEPAVEGPPAAVEEPSPPGGIADQAPPVPEEWVEELVPEAEEAAPEEAPELAEEEAAPEEPLEPDEEQVVPEEPSQPDEEVVIIEVSESEITYYAEGNDRVTSKRAVLGGETYSMANTTSVSMEAKPANRVPSLILAVLGVIITISALLDIWGEPVLGILLTVGGLVVLGIGVLLTVTAKPTYIVRLQGIYGQVNALASPDQDHVERVVSAIEMALSESG